MSSKDLRVTLSGVTLDNPVIPASGTYGFGQEFTPYYDINILGSLCVQSSGDQVITPDSADVILQGVRSKTKGVLRLESVPHVCTISREGTRIAQALGTFFRKAEESERA